MLSWDEEVTPTASLPPASSGSVELVAACFPGPNAVPTVALSSSESSSSASPATAPVCATASRTPQRVNAADKRIETIMDPQFRSGTPGTDQNLLKSLIVFTCLVEGRDFYEGFTQILALGRQNKMTGAGEQFQYILRDESMHCNFDIDLINELKLENPQLWTAELKAEISALFATAVKLEDRYAEDTMPHGVLGMTASMFKGYLRFIANRRATQIRLEALYPNEENPFPWMSAMIDLRKARNFFETRVIDYQSGVALSWE